MSKFLGERKEIHKFLYQPHIYVLIMEISGYKGNILRKEKIGQYIIKKWKKSVIVVSVHGWNSAKNSLW